MESNTQTPILVCTPRAISFEESPQSNDDNVVRKETELTGSCKTRVSPTEGSQAQAKEHVTSASPGLPEDEDLRTQEGDTFPELDDLRHALSVSTVVV